MRLVVLTRTALGVQILVGGVLFILAYLTGSLLGLVPSGDVREIADAIAGFLYAIVVAAHVVLALATPVLALVALRPGRRGLPGGSERPLRKKWSLWNDRSSYLSVQTIFEKGDKTRC